MTYHRLTNLDSNISLNKHLVLARLNRYATYLMLRFFQTRHFLGHSSWLSHGTCVGCQDLRHHIPHTHLHNTAVALRGLLAANHMLATPYHRCHQYLVVRVGLVLATDCRRRQCLYRTGLPGAEHHDYQHKAPLQHRGRTDLGYD